MTTKTKTLILIPLILFGLFISLSSVSATTTTKTLYSFVKDAAGNISNSVSGSVDITLPSEPANTYYVSFTEGLDTNNGTSPSTPWKTIAKVNSETFTPGASILFKKGDTWTGETITVNSSGNSSNPITYSSYGTGAQPVISGFTTVTGWTSEGDGIYSKAVATESSPNLVTINGVMYGMGRYPNTGTDLIYETHNSNISITDNDLNSAITNWTGAEAVIRKNDYTLDRTVINSHSGSTLNYTSLASGENATDGFYYFIQNDLRTLNTFGEWYYGSGKLYMYFGGQTPSNYVVKVASVENLLYATSRDYITVSNLSFEGANLAGINFIWQDNYISIINCNVNFSGGDGILFLHSSNGLIDSSTVNNVNGVGIGVNSSSYTVVTNNTITNCGLIQGGTPWGGGELGMIAIGNDNLFQYNTIDNVGYHGVYFGGDRSIIKNNLITNYCLNLDDGGGIYTDGSANVGRTIDGNIVLYGNRLGAGMVEGIYLDQLSANITVINNTVAYNAFSGIKIHNANSNIIQNNTAVYNRAAVRMQESDTNYPIYGISLTGNILTAEVDKFSLMYNRLSLFDFGTANNNYYVGPLNQNVIITSDSINGNVPRPLSNWQSYTGQDLNSTEVTIPSPSDLFFDYNATKTNKTIPLTGTYKKVDGTTVSGSITLDPYTSIVLIKTN